MTDHDLTQEAASRKLTDVILD
ncbi:MAG: hypothetical protein RLZZ224_2009, partial [Verrucomicrobiota bacterium]